MGLFIRPDKKHAESIKKADKEKADKYRDFIRPDKRLLDAGQVHSENYRNYRKWLQASGLDENMEVVYKNPTAKFDPRVDYFAMLMDARRANPTMMHRRRSRWYVSGGGKKGVGPHF